MTVVSSGGTERRPELQAWGHPTPALGALALVSVS